MMKLLAMSILLILISQIQIYAKDCDSELDSHLYQFNENTSGNAEFVFGAYFNNQTGSYQDYYKPMINLGYEYKFSTNTLFYYNGAFKYRISKDKSEETTTEETEESGHGKGKGKGKFKVGFRSFYLQNKGDSHQFKIGFLTSTLNEMLLLDERGLGVDYILSTGIVKTHVFATQIVSEFAREDSSCVSKTTFVKRESGEKPKTFSDAFGGIQFEFDFDHKTLDPKKDDEFIDVTKEDAEKKPFKVDIMYYVESYDYLKDFKHFADFHQSNSLFGLSYAIEGAFQFYNKDVSFGGIGKLSKTFFNDTAGMIKLFTGYTGWREVKGDSPFMPVNSNLFLSDRQQYLTYDNNIVFYGINYRPVKRIIFEVASYHNLGSTKSMELDANITLYYTESAKVKLGYNRIHNPDDSREYYNQFYAEIRHIF